MFLSRGGIELNEIWHRQVQLVESDERIRSLERRVQGEPGDAGARHRLVTELRRAGRHEEAAAHQLQPHAQQFAEASRRAHDAALETHKHWQTQPNPFNHPKTDEIEARWGKAHEAMEDAREAFHAEVGRALRARGDKSPLNRASTASGRYRVLMAHGAKHLPKQDNWGHEHSLLMHHHNGKSLAGNPEPKGPGGTGGGVFQSDAAKHSFLHSLVTRHPNLRLGHGTDQDGGHHVFVHLENHKTTPVQHKGGSVRDHDTGSTVTSENYLSSHPPHRHGQG